jgi:hypothetical protein
MIFLNLEKKTPPKPIIVIQVLETKTLLDPINKALLNKLKNHFLNKIPTLKITQKYNLNLFTPLNILLIKIDYELNKKNKKKKIFF